MKEAMQEIGPDPNLVEADERRKMEIRKLTSTEYEKAHEHIRELLLRCGGEFGNMNYIKSQTRSAKERLADLLLKGDAPDIAEVTKATAEYKEQQEHFRIKEGMDNGAVIAVTGQVEDFLKQFGLDKLVFLSPNMSAEQIQKAIEIAYEARMWELTNRL